MSVYPGVVVDWCITAKVKGKGKPQRHQEMGDAHTATDAMSAWLEQFENESGDLRIEVEAELTSEQLPGWVHEICSKIGGMPAEEAVEYSANWLFTSAGMANWGGGGGP